MPCPSTSSPNCCATPTTSSLPNCRRKFAMRWSRNPLARSTKPRPAKRENVFEKDSVALRILLYSFARWSWGLPSRPPRLRHAEPVPRIVLHDRLNPVKLLLGRRQEFHALGPQFLVGFPAIAGL